MAAKEIVLALRLSEGTTREQFRALKGALIDVRDEITQNNKALRDNAKEQRALDAAVKEGAVTTEQAAVRSQALLTARELLKNESANLASAEASLAAQYRESKNEVGGLTDAGLRFRDKMADATLAAINQSDVLNKLGTRMEFLRTEQDRLTKEFNDGKLTADQYKAAMDKLSTEEKDLAAQTTLLNGKVDLLTKEFKEGKISADQFRAGIAGIDQSVKGVGSAVSAGVADLKSYALGFVGVVAVAQGAINVIKGVATTVVSFQKANANLAAILGTTRDKIGELTDSAIRIGPAFARAPEEVSQLQTELAKLGFTVPEILQAQEAVIALANATGEGLGKSAEVAAATLNGFNLQANETGRIVDVIAEAANASSLDLEKFSVAMATVAPAANQAGFSIEQTTALVGVLSDRGLDASVAGTALRSIFIDLAKTGKTFDEAMAEINGSTNKTNTAFGLFGERAAGAAVILAEAGKETSALTAKLNDAGGAAEKVAKEQLDTLSGAADRLGSAWKAAVLSFENGEGKIAGFFKTVLEGFTSLLDGGTQAEKSAADLGTRVRTALEDSFGKTELSFDAVKVQDALREQSLRLKTTVQEDTDFIRNRIADYTKEIEGIVASANKSGSEITEFGKFKLTLLSESVKELTKEVELRSKASEETKKTAVEEVAALGTVKAKREELNAELETSKAKREALDASDTAGIAAAKDQEKAIQAEIDALDGKTAKDKEQTDVEKEKITVTQALTKAEEDRTRAQEIAAKAKTIQAADPTIAEPQAQAQAAAIIDSTARIAAAQGDAELLKRIETQLQEDLAAIDAKFAADKVKNQDKANADLRTRNAALAQNELDALIERQNAELILAAKNGDDVNALAQSQAEARIALTQQIEDAKISKLLEDFDTEYAIEEAKGSNLLALVETQQRELAALKASFRQTDIAQQLELNQQLEDADQALLQAKIDAAGAIGNALVTIAAQGSDAAKIGLAIQKAAAVAQVIVQSSAAIAAATAAAAPSPTNPPFLLPGVPNPSFIAGVGISLASIARIKLQAGVSIATIIAQAIAGFDQGGEVGSGNGTIKRSWGKPIRRKNGDNVLITAREGEKILNEDQQEELERLAGRDVWKRIGLPGAKYHGKTRDTFLQANGYATGGQVSGLVNASMPVLTAIESVAEQRSFELNVVADIEEIVSVTNRRMAILETSRSR